MNAETFTHSNRKFLTMVGVNSQREIEQAVARAIESRKVGDNESLPAKMRLSIGKLELDVTFDGEIRLG
jgi:hypothetical protein